MQSNEQTGETRPRTSTSPSTSETNRDAADGRARSPIHFKHLASELSDRILAFEKYINESGLNCKCSIQMEGGGTLTYARGKDRWCFWVRDDLKLSDASINDKICAAAEFPKVIPAMIAARTALVGRMEDANKSLAEMFRELDVSWPTAVSKTNDGGAA